MRTALCSGASGESGAAVARHVAGAGYGVAVHGVKHFEAAQAKCRATAAPISPEAPVISAVFIPYSPS